VLVLAAAAMLAVAPAAKAGIAVRRIDIPGAGHFWASDPFEGEPGGYGATTAPRLLRFLGDAL
jgi:hypothetical protein